MNKTYRLGKAEFTYKDKPLGVGHVYKWKGSDGFPYEITESALLEMGAQLVEEKKECNKRWTDLSPAGNKIPVYCGHPLPCPHHPIEEEKSQEI